MNNGIDELAEILHGCKNPPPYTPMFGTIEELPELKIRLNSKVILTARHIESVIDLYETNSNGEYVYLHKSVAMLPFDKNNRYLILGVIRNG